MNNSQRRRQVLANEDDRGHYAAKRAFEDSDNDEAPEPSVQRRSKSARLSKNDDQTMRDVSQSASFALWAPSNATMKSKTTIQQTPQPKAEPPVDQDQEQLRDSGNSDAGPGDWRENALGRALNKDHVLTRKTLRPGDIIWAPWHVTALKHEGLKVQKILSILDEARTPPLHDEINGSESTIADGMAGPRLDALTNNTAAEGLRWFKMEDFVQSKCAVVNSKRRMFCVHYVHAAKALQAFPMFTHRKRGLKAVPEELRRYRIPVRDKNDMSWHEPWSHHIVVEIERGSKDWQMRRYTTLDYTTSYPIDLSERIEKVGRMSEKGLRYIVRQHEELKEEAHRFAMEDREEVALGKAEPSRSRALRGNWREPSNEEER